MIAAPAPTDAPHTLDVLGEPAFSLVVHGEPAPQGSKTPGKRKDGSTFMRESSKAVKPWRAAVGKAALEHIGSRQHWHALGKTDRDALLLDLVVTVARPTTRPKTLRVRPAVKPDLDKIARSTLDALTNATVLVDDGRVVGFRRLEEFYAGDPDPDALSQPGAVIRVWQLPVEAL